jgi:hypothetical protein
MNLQFDHRCGENVEVQEEGLVVHVKKRNYRLVALKLNFH